LASHCDRSTTKQEKRREEKRERKSRCISAKEHMERRGKERGEDEWASMWKCARGEGWGALNARNTAQSENTYTHHRHATNLISNTAQLGVRLKKYHTTLSMQRGMREEKSRVNTNAPPDGNT
jgi:hypothetical protein